MRLLHTPNHNPSADCSDAVIYKRIAARGIILDHDEILMIYTKRYNDYSFPGGGVDTKEDIIDGLKRELSEETGALNVNVKSEFGIYEECRPTYYEGYDLMHMFSHFYVCQADKKLGESHPEDYEVANGSVPVWVNIHEAIAHNTDVINSQEDSMGLSIVRETRVLELVRDELVIK